MADALPAPATSDPVDLDAWYRTQVLVHEAPLLAYLRRAFPAVSDPENLVQETFSRVLQAHRQGGVQHARSYLYTTARHLALNLMRRHGIVPIDASGEIESLGVTSEERCVVEQVALRFDLEVLREAIAALPERCRQVLTLRKIDGLSQRDIAARLGIAEHTVEVQVANGMRRCAEFFRKRGLMPARKDAQ